MGRARRTISDVVAVMVRTTVTRTMHAGTAEKVLGECLAEELDAEPVDLEEGPGGGTCNDAYDERQQ